MIYADFTSFWKKICHGVPFNICIIAKTLPIYMRFLYHLGLLYITAASWKPFVDVHKQSYGLYPVNPISFYLHNWLFHPHLYPLLVSSRPLPPPWVSPRELSSRDAIPQRKCSRRHFYRIPVFINELFIIICYISPYVLSKYVDLVRD